MVIGIVRFRRIEGMDWVNAVYFETILATGQGPPLTLATNSGKIRTSERTRYPPTRARKTVSEYGRLSLSVLSSTGLSNDLSMRIPAPSKIPG